MKTILTILLAICSYIGYSQEYSTRQEPFKYEYVHELKESPVGKFTYVKTYKSKGVIAIPSISAMKVIDSVIIDRYNFYCIKYVHMPTRSFYALFRYRNGTLRELGFQFVDSDKLFFYSKEPSIYGN